MNAKKKKIVNVWDLTKIDIVGITVAKLDFVEREVALSKFR